MSSTRTRQADFVAEIKILKAVSGDAQRRAEAVQVWKPTAAAPNAEAEAVRVLQELLRRKGLSKVLPCLADCECDLSVLIQQLSDKHPGLKASRGRSHFFTGPWIFHK
jgi:hypothetical protein